MSKKQHEVIYNPFGCPFREFKDSELSIDLWGLGPASMYMHASSLSGRKSGAALLSNRSSNWDIDTWVDDQVQPLPRSVRKLLHGWKRAQNLAEERWDADVLVFDETTNDGKMTICDVQISHAEVLLRSVFSRMALSACYILESFEGFTVEHQGENFTFAAGSDGWRARYHIYSPGMKPGGGVHHRPELSKHGCYLVRLYYLGAWRCIWVSDQVPVDADGAPLLPFSPVNIPGILRSGQSTATNTIVELWPLLVCKALLKLAAPDMDSDHDDYDLEDEDMGNFNVLHALTGCLDIKLKKDFLLDPELMWNRIVSEVPVFAWDEDQETTGSTSKTKSTVKLKKISGKLHMDGSQPQRKSLMTATLQDSKEHPPYALPGLTPAYEMSVLLKMARDLPMQKPPEEPEIALWKHIRWVDWARKHGLYDEYACPRTRFLKMSGLMKLSYAPHLLNVQSTDSITFTFRALCQDKALQIKQTPADIRADNEVCRQNEQLLREWVLYDAFFALLKSATILYFPSTHQFASAASSPPIRFTHREHPKSPVNKNVDLTAPKYEPLYLQIDGHQDIKIKISLNVLHPRVLYNCGVPVSNYIESAYLVLEEFFWFDDHKQTIVKAFLRTSGCGFTEVSFLPGRHFCRVWVHSRLDWHMMIISDASILLGGRDVIMAASTRESPWISKLLTGIGTSFINWVRSDIYTSLSTRNDFFRSYEPDLNWDPKIVGYNKKLLHWMFKTALASTLRKRLILSEYDHVCKVLSRYFKDPEFGMIEEPTFGYPLNYIFDDDPCDCEVMDSVEGGFFEEESFIPIEDIMSQRRHTSFEHIPTTPETPIQICDFATKENPCGALKKHFKSISRSHQAAAKIQALWRGFKARRCLKSNANFTADTLKLVMDAAFGSTEAISYLMNEFFKLFPGAIHAYSVASGLNGNRCLEKYSGTTPIYSKCKWVPFFQAVFYCHFPVKVHFNLNSSLPQRSYKVYDNDTKMEKLQIFNLHNTFEFYPNIDGFTVVGFGIVDQKSSVNEATWTLTVLCDSYGFHICDNNYADICTIFPLHSSIKFRAEDMYIPNGRNLLSGIHITASKTETISFRAAASDPDIELVAILRVMDKNGPGPELERKYGKGELYWPFIRLKGPQFFVPITKSLSMKNKRAGSSMFRVSSNKPAARKPFSSRSKRDGLKPSQVKMKEPPSPTSKNNQYLIEVIAPNGWPLTIDQWKTVVEVLNNPVTNVETYMQSVHSIQKKSPRKGSEIRPTLQSVRSVVMPKHKIADTTRSVLSLRASKIEKMPFTKEIIKPTLGMINTKDPKPEDAFLELECAYSRGSVTVRLDDDRYLRMSNSVRAWNAKEKHKMTKCITLRESFRKENLILKHEIGTSELVLQQPKGGNREPEPSLRGTSSNVSHEIANERETYLTLPPQMIEEFYPLDASCFKEATSDKVILTPDREEAAKREREARATAELNRLAELQQYNKEHILGRQRRRSKLLDQMFSGGYWSPNLSEALLARDDAIAEETLTRKLSVERKKQENKAGGVNKKMSTSQRTHAERKK